MLIKALCDYADKKSTSPNTDAIPDGFAKQDISYRIILSPDGDLLDIISVTEKIPIKDSKGKEKTIEVPRKIILPKRTGKSAVDSNFIEHRPLYIFGLNYESGVFTPIDKTNKAQKSHQAFVNHELEFFDGLNSEVCTAYKNFIQKWNPEEEINNEILKKLGGKYKSYYGFSLGVGKAELEKDAEFIEKYSRYNMAQKAQSDSAEKFVCGILGEKLPIATIHGKIKIRGKGASPYGCPLVCMNEKSSESYCKEQSSNSSISIKAMEKYTTMLNGLLSDKGHHITLDDMTIIYFAMKNDDSTECRKFSTFLADNADGLANQTEQEISTSMRYAKGGYTTDQDTINRLEADNDVTFYIVGITPYESRISQKFIYRDKFGNILKNIIRHQNDMRINADSTRPVYFSDIKKQLLPPKSNEVTKSNKKNEIQKSEEGSNKGSVPSSLMASILLSVFNGNKYPDALLSTVVRRVKIDRDKENKDYLKLNSIRAGIIKACLNRKYNKEEITMAWNEENKNPAYLCGGLFAIYERIQKKASDSDLNRTITDAYFASACTRPSSVFITLSKLSQNHLRKIRNSKPYLANQFDNDVANIMDSLVDGFPLTLDIDNQGRFIIGYYQMKNKLRQNSNKQNNTETNNIEE